MRERMERLWPSLVALVGTVGVVAALLWMFGGDVDDSTPEDISADAAGPDGEGGADGGDSGTTNDDAATSHPTDEPTDEPTDGETDDTDPDDSDSDDTEASTAPPELREPVGIANQTDVEGLEDLARDRLEEGGWEVAAVSGFTGNVPETTVYYPEGQEEAAEALAAQFPEIGRVMPTFEGINNTRLVVVLVEDYVDEVGEPE